MGIYGFANIEIVFEENTSEDQIKTFFETLESREELSISNIKDNYFEVHSMRVQNLEYQCSIVIEICKVTPYIAEASFSGFTEYDLGVYYNKGDE